MKRRDDVRRNLLHVECLELGEGARHVEEAEYGLATRLHLEAPLARLLTVDHDRRRGHLLTDEQLQLRSSRLEGASGLARLDEHGRRAGALDSTLRHRSSRFLRRRLRRGLLDRLLGRHRRWGVEMTSERKWWRKLKKTFPHVPIVIK